MSRRSEREERRASRRGTNVKNGYQKVKDSFAETLWLGADAIYYLLHGVWFTIRMVVVFFLELLRVIN